MAARTTLHDVARAAGVSLSTASRVARGAPGVRPEVRERVLAAIAALGYQPDAAARSIRTGSSHAAGLVVADVMNPYFAAVFTGAEAVLAERDYALFLASSGADAGREEAAVRSLRARRIDGLLLAVADEDAPYLRALVREVPTVLLDREIPGARVDVVRSDHALGIGAAVRRLVGLGHRRLAMLAGSTRQLGTRARVEAFRDAARACRLPARGAVVVSEVLGREAAAAACRSLLAAPGRPTAVLAASSDMIVASLDAAQAAGLDIPGDLSYVACEDFDVCRLHVPPVDVVHRDTVELGATAAGLLLERLRRPRGRPRLVELPTELLVRASSGPARA